MKLYDRIVNKFWRTFPTPKSRIPVRGKTFKMPRFSLNNFYISSYTKETWFLEIIERFHGVSPILSFVDVGVNIGQTLLKIKSVTPEVTYFGFEPNPFCYSFTKELVEKNLISNTTIVPCGLYNTSQLLKLPIENWEDKMDSSTSLIEGFRRKKNEKYEYVPVIALDNYYEYLNVTSIDFMKVDIEGGELDAFKGMRETLKRFIPVIMVEVLPTYTEDNMERIERQSELSSLVRDLNYEIYQINKSNTISLKKFTEFPRQNDVLLSDYLLIPGNYELEKLGFKIE